MATKISSTFPDASAQEDIYYPDSDGQPMANNTEHFERIATTKHGLESAFADRDDVFVAGDLFWYPVKGKPKTVLAPDVMVAIGRPKGRRKSYKQWEESGIAPQVVFEFLSEANTTPEMARKAMFFERYGVQEYYIYDLEAKELSGFVRYQEQDDELEPISDMNDWRSPRLGIRFDMSSGDLQLFKPDNTPFLSYEELDAVLKEREEQLGITRETLEKTQEQLGQTQEQLDHTTRERDEIKSREQVLAAKLRELGINPDDVA